MVVPDYQIINQTRAILFQEEQACHVLQRGGDKNKINHLGFKEVVKKVNKVKLVVVVVVALDMIIAILPKSSLMHHIL